MMSRCAFGCGGNGDLEQLELAQRSAHTKRQKIDDPFESADTLAF